MDVEALKTLGTFGALGLICAWLLWKDYAVGARERHTRHALTNAISANTVTTEKLVEKLEDLDRAIWQFILTRGGSKRQGDEP